MTVENKRNTPDSGHYVKNKLGPVISFFHKQHLFDIIEETEKLIAIYDADKPSKEDKVIIQFLVKLKDKFENHPPDEWRQGVEILWPQMLDVNLNFKKVSYKHLRKLDTLLRFSELCESHAAGETADDTGYSPPGSE